MTDNVFIPSAESTQSVYTPEFAVVVQVAAAGVRVRFEGDADAGQKYYKRLASYSPAVNDRVLVYRTGGSAVVLGKII